MKLTLPISVKIQEAFDDTYMVLVNDRYLLDDRGSNGFPTFVKALDALDYHLTSNVQLDSRKFLLYWSINGGISETQDFSYFKELNDYMVDDIEAIDKLAVGASIHFDLDGHFVVRVE
jgi:hypothetical protein